MPGGLSFVANGNIAPSRFVKMDATATGKVVAATSNTDFIFGISQQGTRNTPYSSLDDGYAAIAGENIRVYTDNEDCWVETGTVTTAITPGDHLTASTAGVAIRTVTDKDVYGAIALEPATASGKLIKVRVVKGNFLSI